MKIPLLKHVTFFKKLHFQKWNLQSCDQKTSIFHTFSDSRLRKYFRTVWWITSIFHTFLISWLTGVSGRERGRKMVFTLYTTKWEPSSIFWHGSLQREKEVENGVHTMHHILYTTEWEPSFIFLHAWIFLLYTTRWEPSFNFLYTRLLPHIL